MKAGHRSHRCSDDSSFSEQSAAVRLRHSGHMLPASEVGMVSAAESDEVCLVCFFGGGPLLLLGVGSCIKQSSEDW